MTPVAWWLYWLGAILAGDFFAYIVGKDDDRSAYLELERWKRVFIALIFSFCWPVVGVGIFLMSVLGDVRTAFGRGGDRG